MLAIGPHGCRNQSASAVLAFTASQGGNSDTRRKALQVNSEVHVCDRLVKVVDVEQDIVLRRNKCTEVHHMAVATGLNLDSGYRLVRQVCCHDSCSAAQKGVSLSCDMLPKFLALPKSFGARRQIDGS